MSDTTPTRTCHPCGGAGGKTESSTETRDGQQIHVAVWRQCTACGGSGQVPA